LLRLLAACPRVEVAFEVVEPGAPEAPVALEPAVELGQGSGPQGIDAPRPVGADLHQLRLTEDAQVAGHGRLRQRRERSDELSGRPLTPGEEVQDCAARRLCHGFEDVHGPSIWSSLYKRNIIDDAGPL